MRAEQSRAERSRASSRRWLIPLTVLATTPGWTSLAHASGVDTGAPGASTGQALQSESTACVIEPDADAPTAAWHRDAGGEVQPMLQVSPSTIEGAQFWVDSRLTFHGQAIAWSTGPFDATGPDALLLPIDLPPAARLDPAQTDYVSVIVSRVRLEHAPNGHARRSTWATAPLLSAVFPADGAPVLLDADQAAAVAPAGVYAASERARWSQLGVDVHQPGLTLGPEVR